MAQTQLYAHRCTTLSKSFHENVIYLSVVNPENTSIYSLRACFLIGHMYALAHISDLLIVSVETV